MERSDCQLLIDHRKLVQNRLVQGKMLNVRKLGADLVVMWEKLEEEAGDDAGDADE